MTVRIPIAAADAPGTLSLTLLVIAMLLGLRYVFVRQAQKRSDLAKSVPPRPLGLSDESSDKR